LKTLNKKLSVVEVASLGGKAMGEISHKKSIEEYYANPKLCKNCGKVIEIKENECASNTRKKLFCSRSCSATNSNIKRARPELTHCRICGCKKSRNGKIWNAGASGQSQEERKEMWENREKYLGKMATVEYFGFSEYSIPRFPKFKGIRE